MDVVGWSLGGLVAQELCCVAPSEVRRAVLASTVPGGDDLAELISRDFFAFYRWSPTTTRGRGEAAAAARRRRGVRPRLAGALGFQQCRRAQGRRRRVRRRPPRRGRDPRPGVRPGPLPRTPLRLPGGTSCSTATSTPSSTRRSRRGSPSARRAARPAPGGRGPPRVGAGTRRWRARVLDFADTRPKVLMSIRLVRPPPVPKFPSRLRLYRWLDRAGASLRAWRWSVVPPSDGSFWSCAAGVRMRRCRYKLIVP